MQAAFYKGKGNWINAIVRWWTKSPYSHCELVIGDDLYSASGGDDQVRTKKLLNPEHWDFVELGDFQERHVLNFFDQTRGMKYDMLGLLLINVFGIPWQTHDRWFCSPWVAHALGLSGFLYYTPASLERFLNPKYPSSTKLTIILP